VSNTALALGIGGNSRSKVGSGDAEMRRKEEDGPSAEAHHAESAQSARSGDERKKRGTNLLSFHFSFDI
jgi:hypothetical protein